MARVCPLFSGSAGNSYYVGSKSSGILIDAGRSAKQLDVMLKNCGIDALSVQAIMVTHEHSDHVSGLRVFAKKYQIPVFASQGTLDELREKLDDVQTYEMGDDLQIANMQITAFHTPHDCVQPLGYRIKTHDDRIVALATDIGHLSQEVENGLLGANFVVIESNHDIEMLRNGPYPHYLQRRILSSYGHLCNEVCAAFLPRLVRSGTTRLLLAHLSGENNTYALAYNAAMAELVMAGFTENEDFTLAVAQKENSTGRSIIF